MAVLNKLMIFTIFDIVMNERPTEILLNMFIIYQDFFSFSFIIFYKHQNRTYNT